MRFPPKTLKADLVSAEQREKEEAELAKEIEDGAFDDDDGGFDD